MTLSDLEKSFFELIRKASTEMPADVVAAIDKYRQKEAKGTPARNTLDLMIENIEAAVKDQAPLCQDTGTIIFYIEYGPDFSEKILREAARKAVSEATAASFLRPNAVDPITGKNPGDNLGEECMPYIHFSPREENGFTVKLMLKGGGCENVSTQYSLPNMSLEAGRDMKGVRKCVIDAVVQAQGLGCAPGALGVGIGGDRMQSHIVAKEQLFRKIDDINPDPLLAEAEKELEEKLNKLNIGPMGFGGSPTVFGVKIGKRMRHPASFYVSIAYMCWAFRRKTMTYSEGRAAIFD